MTEIGKYQIKLGASSDATTTQQKHTCVLWCFCVSWLILRSSVTGCLTTSSTVTGRLCFHVSLIDNRLRRACAVSVCPGNVFVFICCLTETCFLFFFLFPSSTKATHTCSGKPYCTDIDACKFWVCVSVCAFLSEWV